MAINVIVIVACDSVVLLLFQLLVMMTVYRGVTDDV